MPVSTGIATAVVFVWAGMVLAISFIEAPLKFRAPGVTVQIGLGIGRLVFRALNTAEVVLALALASAALIEHPPREVVITGAVALSTFVVQLAVLRPRLKRHADLVLAGADAPRSHTHYLYVGFELVKLSALLATGTALLVSQ